MRQKSSDVRHPTITTVQERVDHHQQVDCLPLRSQRPRNAIVDPIATRTAPSSTHRRNPSVATWLLQRHRRPNIATPASLHHRRTTPIVAQRLLHSMRITAVAAADEKMNMENAEAASAVPLPKRTMFEQFSVQPNNNSSASQPQHSTSQPENQDQDCDYPIGTKLVKVCTRCMVSRTMVHLPRSNHIFSTIFYSTSATKSMGNFCASTELSMATSTSLQKSCT